MHGKWSQNKRKSYWNQLHWKGTAPAATQNNSTSAMEQPLQQLARKLQHLGTIAGLSCTGKSIQQKTHPRHGLYSTYTRSLQNYTDTHVLLQARSEMTNLKLIDCLQEETKL